MCALLARLGRTSRMDRQQVRLGWKVGGRDQPVGEREKVWTAPSSQRAAARSSKRIGSFVLFGAARLSLAAWLLVQKTFFSDNRALSNPIQSSPIPPPPASRVANMHSPLGSQAQQPSKHVGSAETLKLANPICRLACSALWCGALRYRQMRTFQRPAISDQRPA